MSQESEQAQEAWSREADKRYGYVNPALAYLEGNSELKAALKTEIEKRIEPSHFVMQHYEDYPFEDVQRSRRTLAMYRDVLSLLDTVKPR